MKNRKRLLGWFGTFLILAALGRPAHAGQIDWEDHPKALGIILGEPTGLTGKYWVTPTRAWDAGFSYSFRGYLLGYVDHIWHFPGLVGRYSDLAKRLKPYLGLGAMTYFSTISNRNARTGIIDFESSTGVALRLPIGIEWMPEDQPIGLFFELAPAIGIAPGNFTILEGGIGVRFYLDAK